MERIAVSLFCCAFGIALVALAHRPAAGLATVHNLKRYDAAPWVFF
jgi:hypothetical protein